MKMYEVKGKDGKVRHKLVRADGTVKYYDAVSKFYDGFAAVRVGYNWGFIDTDGNEICPIKYEFPFDNNKPGAFWEGYAVVGAPNGKTEEVLGVSCKCLSFGYINTKGEEACPFIYTGACDFRNGVAWVRNEEMKWLLINTEFKTLTKRTYDKIHDFFYGHAVVELDGKFGFINESGDEICEIKYEYMSCFNEHGLAQITIPNTKFDRTYWIDTKGKEYYILFDSNKIYPLN